MEELYNETYLAHYGMPRRSGRYPWGSGEHPFQSAEDFMDFVKESKEAGMSESEIAHALGLSTNVFRDQRTAAKNEIIANRRAQLIKLTSMGYSVNGACNRMGISEHQGRSLLSDATKSREETSKAIFTEFKRLIDAGYYIDVGQGSEAHLGISTERLRAAVHEAERAGYKLINVRQKQMGTHEKTYMKVLCPPGTELMDVVNNKSKICPPNFTIDKDSNDIVKIEKPRSFPSSRVEVRYAEDGGIDRDGLIQIRRGVPELSLGNAKYAQVRIMIDGTHYLKGMAVYADDLPPGIDIRYNVNKHRGTPKMDCMKKIKDDPENPFGANIKLDDELIRAQRHYIDKDGKRQLSCLNIVAEEGTWFEWSKSLPSQMLSKQRLPIIKRQLDKSYQAAALRVHELMQVRNPNIRAALAEQIAGKIDSDADNLRAAAYPRQCSQVILPFPELSENEIYAPNFKDGERVALVRYPHGGIFEIPQLTVRNTGSPAAKVIPNALDAVGINPKVAARLSGADFDGDTVVVIPNNEGSVISAPALKELIDFDPKEAFPGTNCDPKDLIPKDTKEGFNWYLASANHGVASAMNGVGFCYETGCGTAKSMTSAALWYQKAAEKGHSRGLYHLGDCYKNGCGVEANQTKAFECYQKAEQAAAAKGGDAEVEYELGCCYETGSGTEKSPSQAFSWYKKAAQKGLVDAELELAGCYLNGTGVKEDRAAAFNWCQKAAKSGKTEAKFLLGLLYIVGYGVPQNWSKGAKLVRAAADAGNADAQEGMVMLYGMGLGVRRNMKKAREYCNRAVAQGNKDAEKQMQDIEEMYKNPVVSVFLTVSSPFWKSWAKKQLKEQFKEEGMKRCIMSEFFLGSKRMSPMPYF